jgi:glycosyltransferase involved in cell wall biosynthesis
MTGERIAAQDSGRDSRPGERPLVSIVIPCYKQAHLLGDAIESALAQTYPNVEIVVVDDGSPDDPGAVVARYPSVRFVRQPNRGAAAARNAGIRASRGEYIVFLDGDDVLLPHALDTGVEELIARPACAFVHGVCERRKLDGTLLKARPIVEGEVDLYLELLRGNCVRGLHSVVFRRTAIEAVGGFDEARRQAQDWGLYLKIARRFPTYGHGRLVSVYRRHGDNVNGRRHAEKMLRHSMEVLYAQRKYIRGSRAHEAAYQEGVRFVQRLFGEPLVVRMSGHVRAGHFGAALRDATVLLHYYPRGLFARAAAKLRGVVRRRPAPA